MDLTLSGCRSRRCTRTSRPSCSRRWGRAGRSRNTCGCAAAPSCPAASSGASPPASASRWPPWPRLRPRRPAGPGAGGAAGAPRSLPRAALAAAAFALCPRGLRSRPPLGFARLDKARKLRSTRRPVTPTGQAGQPPPPPLPPSRLLLRGKDEVGGAGERQEETRLGRPAAKCRLAPSAGREESLRPRCGRGQSWAG